MDNLDLWARFERNARDAGNDYEADSWAEQIQAVSDKRQREAVQRRAEYEDRRHG